ncbi:MAG: xanthine dehydrogenase family protein subunit M [Acidobacteriota bacterium]
MLPIFDYVRVEEVKDAVRHLSVPGARAHAGGTDLLGCLQDGVLEAKTVVSLSRIRQLKGIREEGGRLRIGATTSIAEIARHPLIKERYRALAESASEVASPQLRNQGTIGGNLCQKPRCWYYRGDFHCLRKGGEICYATAGDNRFHCIFGGDPCYMVHPSDTAPALVALQAELRIVGPKGMRTVAAEDFFILPAKDVRNETTLQPGEIVTDILLPRPAEGVRSSYRKVRARGAWDFALAGVAIAAQMDADTVKTCRLVLAGAAPSPWRSKEAEAKLTGKPLTGETIVAAAEAAVAAAQPLDANTYKVPLFKGLIEQELKRLAAG